MSKYKTSISTNLLDWGTSTSKYSARSEMEASISKFYIVPYIKVENSASTLVYYILLTCLFSH